MNYKEEKKQRQEIVTDKRQKLIIIAELILELVEKDLKIISTDILIVKKMFKMEKNSKSSKWGISTVIWNQQNKSNGHSTIE